MCAGVWGWWRGEGEVLAEEGTQALPWSPQGRHPDTTSSPTSGPTPAVSPGKEEAKSGQSELLNRSSVEKGKHVSSLGKWPSPGWPQAPGLLLRWKKSCSNRSDALFSNPKYPVSAGGSVTTGGKWGKRGGLISIVVTFSFVWGLEEALPAIRESVCARRECGSEIGAGVPTPTVTPSPLPCLP